MESIHGQEDAGQDNDSITESEEECDPNKASDDDVTIMADMLEDIVGEKEFKNIDEMLRNGNYNELFDSFKEKVGYFYSNVQANGNKSC